MSEQWVAYDGLGNPWVTPDLGEIQAGITSAPTVLRLINEGDEPAIGYAVRLLARLDSLSPIEADGLPPLDGRYLEIRIAGGLGGLAVTPGSFEKTGPGAQLELPAEVAVSEGVELEFRFTIPGAAQPSSFRIEWEPIRTLNSFVPGISAEDGGGVVLSPSVPPQLLAGGQVLASLVVDDFIHVDPLAWWTYRPWSDAAIKDIQLDGNDGSAVALVAGEAYWAAVIADYSGGTISAVKGDRAVAPLDPADRPEISTEQLLLAWVTRDFDGLIDQADIDTDTTTEKAFDLVSISGLDATFGRGRAIVGDYRVRGINEALVSLPDDTESDVYLRTDAGLEVTALEPPPDDREATHLRRFTTAAGAITEELDIRHFVGHQDEHTSSKLIGSISVDSAVTAEVPIGEWCRWPFEGTSVTILAEGNQAGQVDFVVETIDRATGNWIQVGSLSVPVTGAGGGGSTVAARGVEGISEALDIYSSVRLRVTALPGGSAPVDMAASFSFVRL